MNYTVRCAIFNNVNSSADPSNPIITKVKKMSFVCVIDNQSEECSTAIQIKQSIREKVNLNVVLSDSLISINKATFPESSMISDKIVSYEAIVDPSQDLSSVGKKDNGTEVVKPNPANAIKFSSKSKPGPTGSDGPTGPTGSDGTTGPIGATA